MNRRAFLKVSAGAVAAAAVGPALPAWADPATAAIAGDDRAVLDGYFLKVLRGFLRNARATSADYTVCDFPQGTKLPGCCTPGGKTYVSVTRMMPAICEYVGGQGRSPVVNVDGNDVNLNDVLLSIYRTAFDPKHPDYWGEPRKDKPTQKTVESSLVAYCLVRLGPDFVKQLTSEQRANVNQWLASCTVVPERQTNHAWFTAMNQAGRIVLGETFPEFKGDAEWLQADLKALDGLYAISSSDGWYSDWPDMPIYEYYNFWTFANFPLFFSRIAGDRYPEWTTKFKDRVRLFLQKTPYFFAANGAHALYGRSLIYRYALLSPMVLGYQEGLWPHAPGLLRNIVRKSIQWHFDIGGYDEALGKFRETYTPAGTADVREAYIDNGHPYWAMQGMTFLSIPADDPFWTEKAEPLPVEKGDYAVDFGNTAMLVVGTKRSGQVQWLHGYNLHRREYFRDKYTKFSSSSHFPPNFLASADYAPWDQNLVFRFRDGKCPTRTSVPKAEAAGNVVRSQWKVEKGPVAIDVTTVTRVFGDFQLRTHVITASDATVAAAMEVLEGSYALGLAADEEAEVQRGEGWLAVRSTKTGCGLVTWKLAGHDGLDVASSFDPEKRTGVNVVYAKSAVITLRSKLSAGEVRLACLHYASPRPMATEDVLMHGARIVAEWNNGSDKKW
jgi:hypothetical protein